MVIQENWKKKKVIPIEELKKQAEQPAVPEGIKSSSVVSSGLDKTEPKPASPVNIIIDFDWEYTPQDIYFQLEDVVKDLIREKKRIIASSTVVPTSSMRRAPRSRAREKFEINPKVKMIVMALVAVLLLSIYPAHKYYRAYKVEQIVKERERIRKYKVWQEKEIKRREKQQYEKAARDYIASAQDRLADAEKNQVEKYAEQMFRKGKGFLQLAQESLEGDRWQKAYDDANSSIMAFEKAKKDAEVLRKQEEERLEKERIANAREALKTKFGQLMEKFEEQTTVAATAIKAMEKINTKSYYPVPYDASRKKYQEGINKRNELSKWASTKGKDLDEVLQARVDVIAAAVALMKEAEKKAKKARTLTKNKKILEQKEKLERTVEKQQQQAERMRKLKEKRLKIKRK